MILQQDDREDVEHVLVGVDADATIRVYGTTEGLDFDDPLYRERGRQFSRFQGHQPKAIPWRALKPFTVDLHDVDVRSTLLSRLLWMQLAQEATEICVRCNGSTVGQLYERFSRAWSYVQKETGSRRHIGYKFSDGVRLAHRQAVATASSS